MIVVVVIMRGCVGKDGKYVTSFNLHHNTPTT